MFPLHDRTRRRITLALFFALCIAPTAVVVTCGILWRLPGQARWEAQKLGRLLGAQVSVTSVRYPRPGVIAYDGLELTAPESGQVVLRCRKVEAERKTVNDEQGQPREFLVLTVDLPEIDVSEFEELRRLVDGALTGRVMREDAYVWLRVGEMTVNTACGSQSLSDVQAKLEKSTDDAWAGLAFRVPGAEMKELAILRVGRKRMGAASMVLLDVDTAGAFIPLSLCLPGTEWPNALGRSTRFRGTLCADLTAEGWSGRFHRGEFDGVDLATLVSSRFPHHMLSGDARVTLNNAEFRQSRLQKAQGSIEVAGGGQIGRSLIDAAVGRLGFRDHSDTGPSRSVAYEQFGISFSIDGQQLELQACCPRDKTAVLVGRDGPLLDVADPQPRSVLALVQMLVPPSDFQVPAGPQTDWLLSRLAVVAPASPSDEATHDERVALEARRRD